MSSYRIKTKYNTEGYYGSVEENYVYAVHNNTVDIVTFYDEKGEWIMSIPDTMDNNLLDAINRLYCGRDRDGNLREDVERVTKEDIEKLNI